MSIETAEKSVARIKDRDEDLVALREELDKLIAASQRAGDALQPRLADARSQLQKLGPAPKKEEPPEAPAVAQERSRLDQAIATLDGAQKTTGLVQVRAKQLISHVQELRREIFARTLLRRHTSPLRPDIWLQIARESEAAGRQIGAIADDWWSRAAQTKGALTLLCLIIFALWIGLHLAVVRTVRRYAPEPPQTTPSFLLRASTAGWVAFALALPTAITAFALYAGLDALSLLYLQTESLAGVALRGVLVFTGVCALAQAILSPERPSWRLFDLTDGAARRLSFLAQAIALVYGIDLFFNQAIRDLFLPITVNIAETFLANIAFGLLLLGVVASRFTRLHGARGNSDSTTRPRSEPLLIKAPILIVALAIIVASILGYVALGRFISSQVLLTSLALLVVLLVHLAIEAIAPVAAREPAAEPSSETPTEVLTAQDATAEETGDRGVLTRGFGLLLNALLALLAIPALLLTWGFSFPDIVGWFKTALFGFEIGQFRISLARILIAVGLFLGLIFMTRLGQRWLAGTVLKAPRVEASIAHSILTVLGYAGFGLAALIGVSYAGFDITNLAIVAGALSVGIGFGLQSIVNNFVSGLILLVERPIKVGDWIIVGTKEGYVRKISVRATEIETFDRASLIVPNAELITGAVTNWTHHNALGRVVINVGVSYDADPDRVTEILLEVAHANTTVLSQPPPLVAFENFGDSALEFSLRAYISNINRALSTRTELRTAILKAFRAEGIEIPFPQQDLHLRDLDGVRQAVAAAIQAQQRKRQSADDGGTIS